MSLDRKNSDLSIRRSSSEAEVVAGIKLTELAFRRKLSPVVRQFLLRVPRQNNILVERDGNIFGYMVLEKRPGYLYIWLIATHPRMQGSGIGTLMLTYLADHLAEYDRTAIQLHCQAKDADANRFYLRSGYVEIDRAADEYGPGNDAVIYRFEKAKAPAAPS